MPSLFRIFEAAIYSLINFLPYLVLALYPFTDNLRFSKKITVCLVFILSVLQIIWGMFAAFTPNKTAPLLSMINTACYLVFYFVSVKEQFGKLLFMLLISSNIVNLVVVAGKCLEGYLFPAMALQDNRWTYSITSIIIQVLVLPPVFLFYKKRLKYAVQLQSNKIIWKYLWFIPATFYIFWYYNLFFDSTPALQLALKPTMTVYTLLINLGAMLVYFVIARAVVQANQNMKLEAENYQLTIQNIQYDNLKERMDEIRRAKHDLRHHLRVIQNYARKRDYERLNEYLENYLKNEVSEQQIYFCSNFALNALIGYYSNLAKANDIDFLTDISAAEKLSVSDTDLTVLFGNLIENAGEACLRLPKEKRYISLKIKMSNSDALVFYIENYCTQDDISQNKGRILSSKHKGYGIGIESAKSIVSRHDGFIKFEKVEDKFCVSGMIYL